MKDAIRQDVLKRRQACSADDQQQAAALLAGQLVPWLAANYPPSDVVVIAGYAACRGELDVWPLMQDLFVKNYQLALPCVEQPNAALMFRHWQPQDSLAEGAYNIKQPEVSAPIVMPTLLLVPLVAADIKRRRIGYGGGYYDRTIHQLKQSNPALVTIGIAHDFQLLDSVPSEAHDVSLDHLFTPTKHISG